MTDAPSHDAERRHAPQGGERRRPGPGRRRHRGVHRPRGPRAPRPGLGRGPGRRRRRRASTTASPAASRAPGGRRPGHADGLDGPGGLRRRDGRGDVGGGGGAGRRPGAVDAAVEPVRALHPDPGRVCRRAQRARVRARPGADDHALPARGDGPTGTDRRPVEGRRGDPRRRRADHRHPGGEPSRHGDSARLPSGSPTPRPQCRPPSTTCRPGSPTPRHASTKHGPT